MLCPCKVQTISTGSPECRKLFSAIRKIIFVPYDSLHKGDPTAALEIPVNQLSLDNLFTTRPAPGFIPPNLPFDHTGYGLVANYHTPFFENVEITKEDDVVETFDSGAQFFVREGRYSLNAILPASPFGLGYAIKT